MLIINDDDVCPECGAYWQNDGHCANGHPRPNPVYELPGRTIERAAMGPNRLTLVLDNGQILLIEGGYDVLRNCYLHIELSEPEESFDEPQ
jgi:hypothetical protein